MECAGLFSLSPTPRLSTVYQYDGVCLLGDVGLMAGLSGFASHGCDLLLGAGC